MEHLRLFENYKSDEEIHKICKEYYIENYNINKDGSIDVDDYISLNSHDLTELPLTFNIVSYGFDCRANYLITLKGSPRIVGKDFSCHYNNLTNLMGSPDEIMGSFYCYGNKQLTSLEGISKSIGGILDISYCNLSDFRGIPEDFHVGKINFDNNPVYRNLKKFLKKYNINIEHIEDKYLDIILEINELDAIQDGKIVDIRMDEVLYNIGLI